MNPITEWQLDTQHLGRRVLVHEVTDSTSTRCAALAGDERNHGLAVLALTQTAGRGQHGRSWLCRPGTGVLLSVLLFPPPALRRPALLTAWAAVSVCELIREIAGLEPQIKWPNDVLIQGRKVCGILIEQQRGVVVGIGLNLNQEVDDFRAEGLADAGSLRMFTGSQSDVEKVARHLLGHLDQNYEQLLTGDLGSLEARWRQLLALVGQEVIVEGHARSEEGTLQEVSFETVALLGDDGEMQLIQPETIRHIRSRVLS
jgi:BirA family biotin operon repressor/biotin-[acetyl-CoA-carboxylase] ligase